MRSHRRPGTWLLAVVATVLLGACDAPTSAADAAADASTTSTAAGCEPPPVQASRNELPDDAVINDWPGTSASPAGIYSWGIGPTRWMHRVSRGAAGIELAFTTEETPAEDADPAISPLGRFASPTPSDCETTPVRVAGFDGTYRATGPGREEWILDLSGTTVRILFLAHPGTTDAELAEARAVVGSISVLPRPTEARQVNPAQHDEPPVIVTFRLPRGWDSG